MLPTVYKVANIGPGTLSVMAKPVAGEWIDSEFEGLRQLGINLVVSLLERHEAYEVGLEGEAELCASHGIQYVSFPIKDRGVPEKMPTRAMLKDLHAQLNEGRHVVVHCRAGIGRTGIIAGAILSLSGYSVSEALNAVSEARGVGVPDTEEQLHWLREFSLVGA